MDSNTVLSYFKEITKIPRESGHEEQIIAYLKEFAHSHNLAYKEDEVGNVLITKPASKGKENLPTIVLQSHTDMVCEKNYGVEHDFSKDPINYVIEDGWMIAKDTTLGADCGIGVAAALAILDSDLELGTIECLFTVEEETGLDGAKALKENFFNGKLLINLDSEDEGELFVGCAGGLDTTAKFMYSTVDCPENYKLIRFEITNAIGGHSGDDIDKGRANSLQLLAVFLYTQLDKNPYIYKFEGGNKRNAIARESYAIIALPSNEIETSITEFQSYAKDTKAEYLSVEPDLKFTAVESSEHPNDLISLEESRNIILSLTSCPHGVLAMSNDIKGLVDTSTNLASLKMVEKGVLRVGTSQRSTITSARRAAGAKVRSNFLLAGAVVTHESEYPGWHPNMDSELLKVSVRSYEKLFGIKPIVRAIHAGLECGLFLDKYPDLDMISFGPTLRGVHAPGERLDLATLVKFTDLLVDVLLNPQM